MVNPFSPTTVYERGYCKKTLGRNVIAGHPKAALLFWFLVVLDVVCSYLLFFLSDVVCGYLLVFLLDIKIKTGENRCLILDLPVTPV